MYNLVYTNRAVKDIKKFSPEIKKRVGKTLLRYQQDPIGYSETLTDANLGTYRFRIGDYRVIFELEGDESLLSGLKVSAVKKQLPRHQTSQEFRRIVL